MKYEENCLKRKAARKANQNVPQECGGGRDGLAIAQNLKNNKYSEAGLKENCARRRNGVQGSTPSKKTRSPTSTLGGCKTGCSASCAASQKKQLRGILHLYLDMFCASFFVQCSAQRQSYRSSRAVQNSLLLAGTSVYGEKLRNVLPQCKCCLPNCTAEPLPSGIWLNTYQSGKVLHASSELSSTLQARPGTPPLSPDRHPQ